MTDVPTPAVPFPTVVPRERTLSGVLGLEVAPGGEGSLTATLAVTDAARQPMGLVHGGTYAAIAEELASMGTGLDVMGEGMLVMGQSNNSSFFRPVTDGVLHAVATRRHRGRSSQVWVVDVTDDAGRLCASSTVTIAVRPPRT